MMTSTLSRHCDMGLSLNDLQTTLGVGAENSGKRSQDVRKVYNG